MIKKLLPLQTERLVLRLFQVEDAPFLYEYLSRPEIYVFEPGAPVDLAQAEAMCKDRTEGDAFIAVCLKESGKLIGHLYFRLAEPEHLQTYELGYIFNPAYQRQGFCTEAVRALVRQVFSEKDVHRIEARCNPLNDASWKVLEKAGFVKEGCHRQQVYFRLDAGGHPIWTDTLVYGLLKSDL